MTDFHDIVSKKWWFILFNVGTIIYLIVTGSLRWDAVSLFSCGVALLLINGIALISMRKYKGKFKGW